MPIEIKELIIRSTITNGEERVSHTSSMEAVNMDVIVERAVERVMEILKQNEER